MTYGNTMVAPTTLKGSYLSAIEPGRLLWNFENECLMVMGIGANARSSVAVFLGGEYAFQGREANQCAWQCLDLGPIKLEVDYLTAVRKKPEKAGYIRARNGRSYLMVKNERSNETYSVAIAATLVDPDPDMADDFEVCYTGWRLIGEHTSHAFSVAFTRSGESLFTVD